VLRRYRLLGEETTIVMRADRQRFLPWALEGGSPGTPSYHIVNPGEGQRVLPQNPMYPVRLAKNDVFVHLGAGGAGVGDALERDPALVLEDVREERLTADYALEVYGVCICGGKVDEGKTSEARARLRSRPRRYGYLRYFLEPLGIKDYEVTAERNLSAR
jgi:N-methylhydantoinase B